MKNKKKVSIIMPTYGRSEYINKAIDSCLNNTYKNIEILIINDNPKNSKERELTKNKINKLYGNNNKVIYLELEDNQGACQARNYGIDKSSGEIICFLDDDDEFLNESIEKLVNHLIDGKYDAIFSNIKMTNQDNPSNSYIRVYKNNFMLDNKSLMKKHLLNGISGTISFAYKKEVLLAIDKFTDIPASQEYILMYKTIKAKYKVGYLNEVTAIGYTHDSENGITGSPKATLAKEQVYQITKESINELKFIDRRKAKFKIFLFLLVGYKKQKNIKKLIIYGIKLIPYIDLLIKFKLNNPNKIIDGKLSI